MTPRRLNPRPLRELPRAIVRACGPGRRHRDESGATLVEFALILPVFAVMLFGMIQFGLAFTGWDQLRNARPKLSPICRFWRGSLLRGLIGGGLRERDFNQYRHIRRHQRLTDGSSLLQFRSD